MTWGLFSSCSHYTNIFCSLQFGKWQTCPSSSFNSRYQGLEFSTLCAVQSRKQEAAGAPSLVCGFNSILAWFSDSLIVRFLWVTGMVFSSFFHYPCEFIPLESIMRPFIII